MRGDKRMPIRATQDLIRRYPIRTDNAALQRDIGAPHQPDAGLAAGRRCKFFWIDRLNDGGIEVWCVRFFRCSWNLCSAGGQKNGGANHESEHIAHPTVRTLMQRRTCKRKSHETHAPSGSVIESDVATGS